MRGLREQLEEAWAINERLVDRIEELKARLSRYEKKKAFREDSIASRSISTPGKSPHSARVFRWPKEQSNKRVIKIRDIASDLDDEVVTTPVRTVYRAVGEVPDEPSSDSSYSSPEHNTTVLDTLNDTIPRHDSIYSNTELGTPSANKSLSQNVTPAKPSKPVIPRVSPTPRPVRIEKTTTGVRVSTKPPRPASRRRIVKAVLPDETTVNQSGVISDSPARTKRQTFRI